MLNLLSYVYIIYYLVAIDSSFVALATSCALIPIYILININVISDCFVHLKNIFNIYFFNNTVIIDGATLLPPYLSVSTSLLAKTLAGNNNRIALFLPENLDCCILKFKGSQGELIQFFKIL